MIALSTPIVPTIMASSLLGNAAQFMDGRALVFKALPETAAAQYLSSSAGINVLLSPRVYARSHESHRQTLRRLHEALTWNLTTEQISPDLWLAARNLFDTTLGDIEATQAYIAELASEFTVLLTEAA